MQEAASTVFLDPRAFEAAFVQAMGEPQNEAIAQLCKLLRTTPETLGNFREEGRRRFRREKSPEARTLALRTEIIAARRALNDARAEFVMDAMVGPGPQNSVQAGLRTACNRRRRMASDRRSPFNRPPRRRPSRSRRCR